MPTFTAGRTLTAAALNLIADKPYARLIQPSRQNSPNNAYTAILFNDEPFDSDGGHDNTTNNTRYTFQRAGRYLIAGTVSFSSNSTGYRAARWAVNGVVLSGSEGSISAVIRVGHESRAHKRVRCPGRCPCRIRHVASTPSVQLDT